MKCLGHLEYYHAHTGKVFRTLEDELLLSSMPESFGTWSQAQSFSRGKFFGMKEYKMAHSRDWKGFPAYGNVKKIYGCRETCPDIDSGIVYP